MTSVFVGLCILAILIVLIFLWIFALSRSDEIPVNVYYWTGNPLEVDAVEALQYLQDTPDATGNYLMNGVSLIPFDTPSELIRMVREYRVRGGRTAITTTGTPLLQSLFPFLLENNGFQLLNLFSTANISIPENTYRFALPDFITFPFVVFEVPQDTIVYYDTENSWAVNTADYFRNVGYRTIGFEDGIPLPENSSFMIVANVRTPDLIDAVPASTIRLYGLDGSAFFPLEGSTAEKATEKQFLCMTYSPEITSPLIPEVEEAIGKQVNYIFPTALDAIDYARLYLQDFSNNEIQVTTTGFSGSLVMEDNSRRYGNIGWYQFRGSNWELEQQIIITDFGTCGIVPVVEPVFLKTTNDVEKLDISAKITIANTI